MWGANPIPTPRLDMYYEEMIKLEARRKISNILDQHCKPRERINELEVYTFDREKRQRLIKKRKKAAESATYQMLGGVLESKNGT